MNVRGVTVLGAGVIGLTCAHALRQAGWDVRVIARDEPTVSTVAGGLWLPYATAGDDPRVMDWALATLDWLEARGHPTVEYRHIQRELPPWLGALWEDRVHDVSDHEWILRVPLVEMDAHLAALWDGPVERREVAALDELDGLVVNATGLGARALCGDRALSPARGQVVHVRAPLGTPCICDEDELTYVLPRRDVCVVGGTFEPGDEDVSVREEQTRDILVRAARLAPGLEGATVLGARAGLRPVRAGGPRVERQGDVIHCYGHGGAGVTLSWGCAQEVVALAGTAADAGAPTACTPPSA